MAIFTEHGASEMLRQTVDVVVADLILASSTSSNGQAEHQFGSDVLLLINYQRSALGQLEDMVLGHVRRRELPDIVRFDHEYLGPTLWRLRVIVGSC